MASISNEVPQRHCHLVVPAFNEVASIGRCLDAALAAPLPNGWAWAEFVVLDDRSDDGTVATAQAWSDSSSGPPMRIVVAPSRRGKSQNLGSWHTEEIATVPPEDVVIVVDADVAIEINSLRSLLRPFASDPELAVVWGADHAESTTFGHWGSAFQMEAVTALARRCGDTAPRAYGRFFAYQVNGLANFCWNSGSIVTDDVQLADFVHRLDLRVCSVWEATALVAVAGNYRDFYLQTYRGYQDMSTLRMSSSEREDGTRRRDRMAVLVAQATRRPHWAIAYAAARTVSVVRHYLGGHRFTALWTPTTSTKVNSTKTSGSRHLASVLYVEVRFATDIVRCAKNWPGVLLSTIRRRFGRGGPNRVFELRTRSGIVLRSPNTAAYHPIYEVAASDVYQLRRLRWSPPPRSVLDIGAHVGTFTCVLAVDLPDATFTCVEPSASSQLWLERNLTVNGLNARVRVLGAALASSDGETLLFEQGEASSVSSTYPSVGARPTPTPTISFATAVVQCERAPELVKMDCEGGEYEAILSSPDDCWASINHLFIEYHPVAGHGFAAIHTRLAGLGMVQVWHRPSAAAGLGIAYYTRSGGTNSGVEDVR